MRLKLNTNDSVSVSSTTAEGDKDSVALSSNKEELYPGIDGKTVASSTVVAASIDNSRESRKNSRVFRDVWYRCCLRPFTAIHGDRAMTLPQAFKLRILRPEGIPVEDAAGFHEMFLPPYQHLSPLFGLIFTYNNFIENLYRYGDPAEPAVSLVKLLFHALPGGEIQVTHLGSSAGAHLSSHLVGNVLYWIEKQRPVLLALSQNSGKVLLKDQLLDLVSKHPDYQSSRDHLYFDIRTAEVQLQHLDKEELRCKQIREKIKAIEGVIVKRGKHKIRRLSIELRKTEHRPTREKLLDEIARQEASIQEATKQIEALCSHVVTGFDIKTARKALDRAKEMICLEKESRVKLVEAFVDCFYAYDPDFSPASRALPLFTNTALFLAFLWRKYDSIHHLTGYMEVMLQMRVLRRMMWSIQDDMEAKSTAPKVSAMVAAKNLRRRGRYEWLAEEKATAAIISILKPGIARRPPVVQFSYIRWADYCEFPDCGEATLRNLFNQLLYNPESGMFDHKLLEELRNRYYPFLHQPLINFYQKYSNPSKAESHSTGKAWVEVVSGLNTDDNRSRGVSAVRYRRAAQQQNIASPLSNVLCVVSALFGIPPPNDSRLHDIVDRINLLREGWNLRVDTSGIKKDGFGIVRLGVGNDNIVYELQSYKPVHFGFVRTASMPTENQQCNGHCISKRGQYDYDVFHQLMRFCHRPPVAPSLPTHSSDPSQCFERLALASLFVPYLFQTTQTGRENCNAFWKAYPPHYKLLFADLNPASKQQDSVLAWAREQYPNDIHVAGYVDRIHDFKEPVFLPPPTAKKNP